jgi:hypothetical protein
VTLTLSMERLSKFLRQITFHNIGLQRILSLIPRNLAAYGSNEKKLWLAKQLGDSIGSKPASPKNLVAKNGSANKRVRLTVYRRANFQHPWVRLED